MKVLSAIVLAVILAVSFGSASASVQDDAYVPVMEIRGGGIAPEVHYDYNMLFPEVFYKREFLAEYERVNRGTPKGVRYVPYKISRVFFRKEGETYIPVTVVNAGWGWSPWKIHQKNPLIGKAYPFSTFRALFAEFRGMPNTDAAFRALPTGAWVIPLPAIRFFTGDEFKEASAFSMVPYPNDEVPGLYVPVLPGAKEGSQAAAGAIAALSGKGAESGVPVKSQPWFKIGNSSVWFPLALAFLGVILGMLIGNADRRRERRKQSEAANNELRSVLADRREHERRAIDRHRKVLAERDRVIAGLEEQVAAYQKAAYLHILPPDQVTRNGERMIAFPLVGPNRVKLPHTDDPVSVGNIQGMINRREDLRTMLGIEQRPGFIRRERGVHEDNHTQH